MPTYKNIAKRYHNLQNFCDHLLTQMEEFTNFDLMLSDPKELSRLETLLKIRTRLFDFEKSLQQAHHDLNITASRTLQQDRHKMIDNLIKKITKANNI